MDLGHQLLELKKEILGHEHHHNESRVGDGQVPLFNGQLFLEQKLKRTSYGNAQT